MNRREFLAAGAATVAAGVWHRSLAADAAAQSRAGETLYNGITLPAAVAAEAEGVRRPTRSRRRT